MKLLEKFETTQSDFFDGTKNFTFKAFLGENFFLVGPFKVKNAHASFL